NGGNDSADTCLKVSQISAMMGYPLTCVQVPKTVDNDLVATDNCPGFGSVAKYVATSMREAAYDVASMAKTSTKIFVMEVMGRHAGWITAAVGLAADEANDIPLLLLFPERPFDEAPFLAAVERRLVSHGYCCIGVSEGLRNAEGKFISELGLRDAFGHAQLGGAGETIAKLIREKLGHKYHQALPDYLQRAGRHLASATDVAQSYAVGKAAVEYALKGMNGVMPAIIRTSDKPYRWKIQPISLEMVANREKMLPNDFITADGLGITNQARAYLQPLITGEAPVRWKNGLPDFVKLKNIEVPKKLQAFTI
ncbi:MAG: 6-phosphofructokinase, partial [Betaproteobacteria bacterium]